MGSCTDSSVMDLEHVHPTALRWLQTNGQRLDASNHLSPAQSKVCVITSGQDCVVGGCVRQKRELRNRKGDLRCTLKLHSSVGKAYECNYRCVGEEMFERAGEIREHSTTYTTNPALLVTHIAH